MRDPLAPSSPRVYPDYLFKGARDDIDIDRLRRLADLMRTKYKAHPAGHWERWERKSGRVYAGCWTEERNIIVERIE